jgi:hypothetical protein
MLSIKAALPTFLASLAVAALLTWLVAWRPFSPVRVEEPCFLQITSAQPATGSISVSIDEGHGYAVDRPPAVRAPIRGAAIAAQLPPGRVRELRVDVENVARFDVTAVSLHAGDRDLAAPALSALHPVNGTIAELKESAVSLRPAAPGRDISFTVRFDPPLIIPSGDEPWAIQVVGIFIAVFALAWLAFRKWPSFPTQWPAITRPKFTIAVLALASALLSTYPVVFFGKSFVSPNTIAYLLHPGEPTIAGAAQEPVEYAAGSDLGAMMWQNLPYSAIESRALLHDHEFPLWNRYNSGGLSLLGQGLSMLGDPLHLIPLAAGGAWWAWNIKFILAKALFAIGVGLCSWSLTRRVGPSALVAVSAAWIGFFAYRFNHPAFFGVCYAPWLLLPWLIARDAAGRGQLWLCAAGLLLANWCELTSGTAKEATMLLICLNATGLLVLIHSTDRWRRVLPMLWANVLFVLLSAPAWLLFLDALRQSVTIYDVPHAYQMQPGLLIAFFDSIFSQDFTRQQNLTHPSLNFLVLIGVLWALWGRRGHGALLTGSAMAAALVFGIVPPSWIVKLPFLGRIEHIYNVFGCVLLVLLLPLAAQGFAACLEPRDPERWKSTWWKVMLSVAGLFFIYLGFTQALPAAPFLSYRIDPPLRSLFFAMYVPCLLLAAVAVPWALGWVKERRAVGWALAAACMVMLHFRSGMFVETKFDDYVMNPRTGIDLVARSPAIDVVRSALQEPARVCGFDATLSPGYQALLGLEGIAGPDALHNPFYTELCEAAGLQTAWGWRLMVNEQSLAKLRPMYDALNLRFYLREIEGPSPQLPGLVLSRAKDLEIYESKTVWPRAFFTNQCASYGSPLEFARMVAQGDGRPFAAMQRTAAPVKIAPMAERQVVPARDYRQTNNSTEFTVQAPAPGVVVLAETYEEGNFEVTVNGRPAQCLRMNHAFKGVVVDRAGALRIRFTYWPRLLKPALFVSLCGLLLALGTVALLWRTRTPIPAATRALDGYSLEA